eukprot:g3908.t1
MASDVIHFMDKKGYSRAHIVGHSLGGKVAMTAALRCPSRVAGLVVEDIAPVKYSKQNPESSSSKAPWTSSMEVVDALKRIDVNKLESRAHANELLKKSVPEDGIRNFVLQNLLHVPAQEGGGLRWRINISGLSKGMRTMAGFSPGCNVAPSGLRTLFLSGGDSGFVSEKYVPAIKALFPRAEFTVLPETGHMVHAQRPQEFISIVSRFLQNVERKDKLPTGWSVHWDKNSAQPYYGFEGRSQWPKPEF